MSLIDTIHLKEFLLVGTRRSKLNEGNIYCYRSLEQLLWPLWPFEVRLDLRNFWNPQFGRSWRDTHYLEAVPCACLVEIVESWSGIMCAAQILQDDRKCAEHGLHDNAQRRARDDATNAAAAVAAPLFVSRFNRLIGHLDPLIASWIGFLWARVSLTVQWNRRKNAVDLLLKKFISSTL